MDSKELGLIENPPPKYNTPFQRPFKFQNKKSRTTIQLK